jgi:glycopeptide antibiotics resistance protein
MERFKVHRSVCIAPLAGYAVLVGYWMLFGWGREPHAEYQYNLIPFATIYRDLQLADGLTKAWCISFLGNIGVFIPFGILLPRCWGWGFWRVLLVHSLGVAVLEVIQLLTKRGELDVDDLLLNTLGFMVGYVIHLRLRRRLS